MIPCEKHLSAVVNLSLDRYRTKQNMFHDSIALNSNP
jgi:hypothetical protein